MPSVVMHTKVILDGGPNRTKFFYQIESDSEGEFSDSTRFEIAVTDGVHLWKGIGVSWKDLMACKPDSIDQASHESFLKEALLGIKTCETETEESALSLHLELTASGNLSFSWKLKQCNFTITLGTIMLLKCSSKDEAKNTIVSMLSDSIGTQDALHARLAKLESELASQKRLTKALLQQYEKETKGRVEWENELYTKMLLLLNTKKERIRQLLDGSGNGNGNEDGDETE